MKRIPEILAPENADAELRRYLSQLTVDINTSIGGADVLSPIYTNPSKPVIGKLYYYGAAIAGDPIVDGEGLYFNKTTGLVKLG